MKAIPLICLLVCCSCGTRQTTSEARTEIRRQEALALREGVVRSVARTDSLHTKLRREHTYKITHLSLPDTTGRQWPLSIEEGSLVEHFATERRTTDDSVALFNRDAETLRTLAVETRTTDKTNLNTRPFPTAMVCLLLAAVAIGIIRFCKYKP